MNLQDFEKLAAQARRATPPRVNVVQAVLHRLSEPQAQEATRPWSLTFAYLAGASAVAASLGMVLALQAWFSLTDPLAGLMNSLMVMIP